MIKLVKYNYLALPKSWRDKHEDVFEGMQFAFLGEVEQMPGHGYYQDVSDGKPYILHIESMVDLTEEEL